MGRYSFCGIGGVVKTFVVILFLFLTVKILGAEYNDEALFMKMIVIVIYNWLPPQNKSGKTYDDVITKKEKESRYIVPVILTHII